MRLGSELATASGVLHEIDIVAKHSNVTAIMELKNRHDPPAKNDVVVFFAKLLDYLALTPDLLLKELCQSSCPLSHLTLMAWQRVLALESTP